ncbi:hypothetical protein [Cupriavidus pampae]|uniref:ATP-binding protein n=1 Tax=Cupriavidus pampae TaxID=659251 RepID=A0ABN7ZH06_9BURK|nr:hypothetical protein [Cupriavidus pampae]CAG9184478.1 hypothetical protein LMG32289_05632 [Cupriavidus pampae]
MWTAIQRLLGRKAAQRASGPSAQTVAGVLRDWPYDTAPLVLVAGSAGTGKSTLVRDGLARLAAPARSTLAVAQDVPTDFWVQAEAGSPWLATHRYDYHTHLWQATASEAGQALLQGIALDALDAAIARNARHLVLDYLGLQGAALQAFCRRAREAAPGLGLIVVEQELARLAPVLPEVDALVLFPSWEWPLALPAWASEADAGTPITRHELLASGHGPLRCYRRVQGRDRPRAGHPVPEAPATS